MSRALASLAAQGFVELAAVLRDERPTYDAARIAQAVLLDVGMSRPDADRIILARNTIEAWLDEGREEGRAA